MNIPSFVLRPKYINNVISYHVGNNMYACNNNRKHYLEKVK